MEAQFLAGVPSSIPLDLDQSSVLGRPRPEYDPVGLPLGAFRAYPKLQLTTSYDDNVFRVDKDLRGDFLFGASSQIYIRSEWSRHYLGVAANATRYQYSEQSSENKTEWGISGAGRADITLGMNLTALLSHASTFESRTSRDQVGAAKPTPYNQSGARVELSYNPYRFGLKLEGEFERYDYSATSLLPNLGGGVSNNDDRDRDEYFVSATALAEFSPGYAAFLRPSYRERTYDLTTDRASGRNSQGYDVDTGLDLLVSRLVTGEAYLGYRHLRFEGPQFHSLSDLAFGASLRWYPTELLNLYLKASRTPNATTLVGASVADDRYVEVGADYEITRNVILQISAAYTGTQFEGITRRDQDFKAQLGIRYLLNRYFTADMQFAHTSRSSNVALGGFGDNVLSLGLTAHP